jgi:antitoxin component of MazEF toxin-antitoxin module
MQAPLTEPAPVETRVSAKVRAVGNSLGIIIPQKVLKQLGIRKGDFIEFDINYEELLRAKRIALIMAMKGSLRRRYGDVEWDYETDDLDEADKPEYEGYYP